ncbi:hypothetical protein COB21_02465 [Candidatus Aerophobetes bacterium]|uniref:2-C-methyl-D-erythritol 4-phosphate cytidylyltransferase n=1 Tax=Aerophobetes bacterium TaxID=2030807 RepID=A0A2A4X5Q4_UNCAE|nr:MAG: hypothetical protein COB21_02465 [Candidatus Aerophobetes bacterium]
MNIHVILLMGGKSSRFKSSLPKQFQQLVGKRVYQHCLDTFITFSNIQTLVIVTHAQFIPMIENENSDPRIRFATAGNTRQLSSKAGLNALNGASGAVIIHDAARPFISKEIIAEHINMLKNHPAINTCIPSADTIIVTPDRRTMHAVPPRETLMRGQTPQSFHLHLIKQAHDNTQKTDATDDCQLVMNNSNIKPFIVQGDEKNIKITYDLDMTIAEHLLREPKPQVCKNLANHVSLKGKVFAITGGTGGIGAAIIKELDAHGAKGISISTSSREYPCDLNDFSSTQRAFDSIFNTYGPIDGLIHAVGSLKISPFLSYSSKDIKHAVDTNFISNLFAVRCIKLKKGAHILNFASSAFYTGRKHYALYSASKAAIVNFTQGLALELPHYYINALVPYRTNTEMRKKNFPGEDPSLLLSPENVAQKAMSILQSGSTGAIIAIKRAL